MDRRLHNLQRLSKNLETFVWSNQTFTSKLAQQGNILLKGRDAKSSRYGKYICTISLELVLFFRDMLARTSSIITSVISTSRISTRAIITTHQCLTDFSSLDPYQDNIVPERFYPELSKRWVERRRWCQAARGNLAPSPTPKSRDCRLLHRGGTVGNNLGGAKMNLTYVNW